ncbi:hypothetical protein B0H17DRAFT_1248825 [Mycena rosella]|uniref:Gamma tubulin complex component C-terminal domain-containing protein n=1 Tax=Mycena rosella TaxID=1033263 RepID=A0AAD7CXD3_MYCRO|nr:hypothetical protein B0H17DRAFT_1248825 [Mycena rosella]
MSLQKNKKSRIYKRTYIHPTELGLRLVEARPPEHPVWIDCGRDIVRFIHRRKDAKEHLVAGVRFKALSPTTLKIMQENHRQVRIRTIRRRADMQAWAYGSMTATGSRMPMGGKQGDGYAPYACHSGGSVDDIKALFRHAVVMPFPLDTDILVTAAKSIYLGIEADLSELTEEAELNRFGRFGAVGFYCTNFISPIHTDKDTVKVDQPTLHPCIQLSKENCGPEDYNFAMVRWGITIRTEENTIWVFDGRDEHGTVMPSQSAMWKEPRLAGTFVMGIIFVIGTQSSSGGTCACSSRARMLSFIQQILTFATFEVLELNWHALETKRLTMVTAVDQLLRDRIEFLDTCRKECMPRSSMLLWVHLLLCVEYLIRADNAYSRLISTNHTISASETPDADKVMAKRWALFRKFQVCINFSADSHVRRRAQRASLTGLSTVTSISPEREGSHQWSDGEAEHLDPSSKGKGKARQLYPDEEDPDDTQEYPPVNDDEAETRRERDSQALERWEVAERMKRKAARESALEPQAPSLLANVTRRASLLWPGRNTQNPQNINPSLGTHITPNTQDSADVAPLDDVVTPTPSPTHTEHANPFANPDPFSTSDAAAGEGRCHRHDRPPAACAPERLIFHPPPADT